MTHVPVMLNEVLEVLSPVDGGIYVDGTFGAGGYTKKILAAAKCQLLAIDRDPGAIERAEELALEVGERLKVFHGPFSRMTEALGKYDIDKVDGVVLDIGVSSMQIDTPERGFSFQKQGPLDMRMDTSKGQTAAAFLNTCDEEELAYVIWKYGEERKSRKIAAAVVAARPLETTLDLVNAVHSVVPKRARDKTDPATKTFQAIRIHVNDELSELELALAAAERALKPGGRLVVVTFHSLEDRIVKNFLLDRSEQKSVSRYQPYALEDRDLTFSLVQRKAIKVTGFEATQNIRARSAKLRWAVRTDCEVHA